MTDFITGVVNEYYASKEDADIGLMPLWRDEVYARQSLRDPAQWDVLRLSVQPLLPRGHHGLLNGLALMALALNPAAGHEVQTIAHGVDLKTAFDMVRQHEITPPVLSDAGAAADGYTLKQVREPENSLSDWRRLQL